MVSFFIGIGILVLGYVFYGTLVERIFGVDRKRQTPAHSCRDGIDFVPMGKSRGALIQLLNIAGVGPIFGPILGALYGPVAFVWIALGAVFAGAVHDYLIGMISIRNRGAHLPALVGTHLGHPVRHVVNAFCLLLLLLVGTVFVTAPARLLFELAGGIIALGTITLLIYIYYIVATLLPVHRIIGPLYPWLGAFLLIASVAVGGALFLFGPAVPEISLASFSTSHPAGTAIFPALFLTISCGALSGFHATQTPIIARTLNNESEARPVFYGMMIVEGVIAMIWCAAALALMESGVLPNLLLGDAAVGPAGVVKEVSVSLLGPVLGIAAVLGVIILPITSGDTAFRSARMIIGDYLGVTQTKAFRRIAIALPLFVLSILLTQMDFSQLWRYFTWANQTLASLALWTATAYLVCHRKNFWIALLPAIFITTAANTHILNASIGFGLGMTLSRGLGFGSAMLIAGLILYYLNPDRRASKK